MDKKKRTFNKVKINVFLDLLLVLIFIVEMEQHFTGKPIHEVLGLIFGAAFIIHVLLHLDWVVKITRGFFKQLVHESRVNYVLNLALLIDMLVTVVSGVLISQTLGLNFNVDHSWETIHKVASELTLIIVALHVAMHWKWIAHNGSKYLFGWIPNLLRRPAKVASQPVQNLAHVKES